jgi:hypothetical protein
MSRYAAKVDANQPAIVQAFRERGCSVKHLHRMGEGCPDLVVALDGVTALVEIKQGKGKLNDAQWEFYTTWPGLMFVVRTIRDVERSIYVMQSEKDIRECALKQRYASRDAV